MKKWLIIGLIVIAVAVVARALYSLSGFSEIEVAEQKEPAKQVENIPAPEPVIPEPARLSQGTTAPDTVSSGASEKDTSAEYERIARERGAPATGEAFTGRDPEGLSYAERIQKEAEYAERARQIRERMKANPPPGEAPQQ